jgi:predicted  nucleic acid-binding Zn-ribbon protein
MKNDGIVQNVDEQARKLMSDDFTKTQAYALFGYVHQQITSYCHSKVDQRVFKTYVADRFDKLESRMDKLESRMDKLESRMDKLESRMDKLESKMDKLESKMDSIISMLSIVVKKLDIEPST